MNTLLLVLLAVVVVATVFCLLNNGEAFLP